MPVSLEACRVELPPAANGRFETSGAIVRLFSKPTHAFDVFNVFQYNNNTSMSPSPPRKPGKGKTKESTRKDSVRPTQPAGRIQDCHTVLDAQDTASPTAVPSGPQVGTEGSPFGIRLWLI